MNAPAALPWVAASSPRADAPAPPPSSVIGQANGGPPLVAIALGALVVALVVAWTKSREKERLLAAERDECEVRLGLAGLAAEEEIRWP